MTTREIFLTKLLYDDTAHYGSLLSDIGTAVELAACLHGMPQRPATCLGPDKTDFSTSQSRSWTLQKPGLATASLHSAKLQ
jgi:hypothetical protein